MLLLFSTTECLPHSYNAPPRSATAPALVAPLPIMPCLWLLRLDRSNRSLSPSPWPSAGPGYSLPSVGTSER